MINPQAYNAAIALNNAGVMLIQRHMSVEAVATIQDALRLMRYSFFGANSEDGQELPLPVSVCDNALQAAWKRTSMTKLSEEQSINPLFEAQIFVVTDHDNPSLVYDSLRQKPNTLCVIKIDPLESLTECDDTMDRMEIESSIMLYNYAIASTCLARGCVESVNENRQNSMKIMKLAQSGATKLLNDSLSYTESFMDIPSSLLLVSMLVLDTLFHMCGSEKIVDPTHVLHERVYPAEAYANDLHVILTAISDRELVLSHEGNGLTSAAPAA